MYLSPLWFPLIEFDQIFWKLEDFLKSESDFIRQSKFKKISSDEGVPIKSSSSKSLSYNHAALEILSLCLLLLKFFEKEKSDAVIGFDRVSCISLSTS